MTWRHLAVVGWLSLLGYPVPDWLSVLGVPVPDWLSVLVVSVSDWLSLLTDPVSDWVSLLVVDPVPNWMSLLLISVPDWLSLVLVCVPDWLSGLGVPGFWVLDATWRSGVSSSPVSKLTVLPFFLAGSWIKVNMQINEPTDLTSALLMDVRNKWAGHQAGACVLVGLVMSLQNWWPSDIDTRVHYLDMFP